ncbi:MAG TPA: hypothetical protein VMU45_14350 [Candidatus Eisenbacteria bacterium]|nr:hypothetical protein [Candidatus Eisenbacteria bacterium]
MRTIKTIDFPRFAPTSTLQTQADAARCEVIGDRKEAGNETGENDFPGEIEGCCLAAFSHSAEKRVSGGALLWISIN